MGKAAIFSVEAGRHLLPLLILHRIRNGREKHTTVVGGERKRRDWALTGMGGMLVLISYPTYFSTAEYIFVDEYLRLRFVQPDRVHAMISPDLSLHRQQSKSTTPMRASFGR